MSVADLPALAIDPEFRALIPPLSDDERAQLEANILAEGCRDALVAWAGTLIDGHNRYDICTAHGIPFNVVEREFPDRDAAMLWSIANQLGRRNLTPYARSEVALKLEPLFRERARENQGMRTDLPQNSAECSPVDTRAELAALAGVSHDTIAKARRLAEDADDATKERLRRGETSVNREYRRIVAEERARPRASAEPVEEEPEGGRVVGDLRELVAEGERFRTVYADPPWRYGNQATRASTDNHYQTMTVEEICAEPVAALVEDDAHLHLWTTNGFLREAFGVMEAWGFTYKSMLIWCKPQMGIGNYWRVSHEILLFGVRGDTRAVPFGARDEMSWHVADRQQHSAKPDVFRQKVERVSPGPYLEMYGRVCPALSAWTVYGNQVERRLM